LLGAPADFGATARHPDLDQPLPRPAFLADNSFLHMKLRAKPLANAVIVHISNKRY
jgi:hypothetical protein